jgi:hypothetical protein
MHIAIFNTHPLFQRHFATELELAQKHLNAGDTVTFLHCDGEMLACETNEEHTPARCALCRQSRDIGVRSLTNTAKLHRRSFLQMNENDIQDLENLTTEFATLEPMMAYMTDNYDIGSSVLSSVICGIKDSTPDMREHEDVLRRYMIAAFTVYRSVRNFLRSTQIDRFYVFNGRMSITRAILRACEAEGIEFFTHECGNNAQTYSTFQNAMPHGIRLMTDLILDHWQKAESNPDREDIGAAWFQNRAKGVKVNGYSFVEQQQAGMLPADRDPMKRHIAIFNTGSFEYAAVSEDYKNHLYNNQIEGLRRIIASLTPYKDSLHLTVRIHPNLAQFPKEIDPILELQSDFVTVVSPESPISTYALIHHSEKVIVFNSTVGIEAVYFGKPSILAGKTPYQELGGNYTPQTHEELIALVLQKDLPAKNKRGALIYGYFLNTFGTPFEFYKAQTFFGGTFNGRMPMANRWLFRLDTLYKRTAPKAIQNLVTKHFQQRTHRKITQFQQNEHRS